MSTVKQVPSYSDKKRDRASEDTTLEELAASFPGYGHPVTGGEPVPDDLADLDRGLRRQPAIGPLMPRGPIITGSGPSFSAQRFADELRSRLSGNAKGWAFAITTNGTLAEEDAGGDARTPDEEQLDMTEMRRLNIASVSKTITAVAVLRLLEETGLTIDDTIWPFLPESWTLGPGVTGLRFRDLLRHESGLTSANNNFSNTLSYAGLATAIETGGAAGSTRQYLNANFALFRIIIPALWRELGVGWVAPPNHDLADPVNEVNTSFFYSLYIKGVLFAQMGGAIGQNASVSELDSNPTRYYNTAASNTGISMGNWAHIAGGGGWHLSARELAAFLANITYNDDVLSPAARAQMDALALGWQPLSQTTGQFGQYRAHGGSIGGGGGHVRTAIVKFSIQCEAALVANSAIAGFSNPVALVIQAFDAAWA